MKKLLLVIVGILFAFNANATMIPEGAVVKTANNPDVYIVKYKNGKQFKRLVLNPQVFESYGHLRWADILTITQSEVDSFTESSLVRSDGESSVYTLVASGDSGDKALVDSNYTYDPDAVYTINKTDHGNYILKNIEILAEKFRDIKLKVATPKIDFCNNIEGDQTSIPTGMFRDNASCFKKVESPAPDPKIAKATIATKQLLVISNNSKSELAVLYLGLQSIKDEMQIKKDETRTDAEIIAQVNDSFAGTGATTAGIAPIIAGALRENAILVAEYNDIVITYNALVNSYNDKLEHYKKMLSMKYVIDDYSNNIYISVADRTFLGSLGINLN
ncbi:MAG: hypothetical protein KAI57_03820 [Candidatus Pacebacteria bacterium]|nr:hypothetical protein [Candidatus Paceibacterota bacterium]